LASTKKAPSAAELGRQLGVTAKTAWLMRRKITHAMARREGQIMLRGLVELDEGYLGGRRSQPAARGRRHVGKTMVAVAAERTPEGGFGRAHLCIIEDASAKSLTCAARATITAGSPVRTDGWRGYAGLEGAGYDHRSRTMPTGAEIDDWLPFSHIVLSNFKRWTLDVFHGVSAAHLQAYLDEFCYRLNRRHQRVDLFRRILNRCLLYTEPATYAQLIAA
jgi:transposase-like protein